MKANTTSELKMILENKPDLQIIDTRPPDLFEIGFIKNSLNVGLKFSELDKIETIVESFKDTITICEDGKEKESVSRLEHIGIKNIKGVFYFNNDLKQSKLLDMIISISAEELVLDSLHNPKAIIIDVRGTEKFMTGKVHNAINVPINELANASKKLIKTQETLIYSNTGLTSILACSFLKANGFNNVKNVWGGFEQIKAEPKAIII